MRYLIGIVFTLTLFSCTSRLATVQADKVEQERVSSGEWLLTDGEGVVLSGSFAKQMNIRFLDGKVSGFSGCNSYHGRFKFGHAKAISIGELATTRVMCPTIDDEKYFLDMLSRVDHYEVKDNQLSLYKGKMILLKFVKK